jgi:hypothetical protein
MIFGDTQCVISARILTAWIYADSVQTVAELFWWAVLVVLADWDVVFD